VAGGILVVLSWTLDAARLMDGGDPGPYPWPLFAAGIGVALVAAADVLLRSAASPATAGPAAPPSTG
jgi:hypothetical protein